MHLTPVASALLAQLVVPAQANLLITEYVEGSGNNKALELTNVGNAPLALADYQLKFFFNGNTSAGLTIALDNLSLAPGASHVVAHASAYADTLAKANQLNSASWFNGDDAIVVYQGSAVADSLGQVGADPGSSWADGSLSTQDRTLRRNLGLTAGDANPFDAVVLAEQWLGADRDDVSNLGRYGSGGGDGGGDEGEPPLTGCGQPATPIHQIQGSGLTAAVTGPVTIEAVVTALRPGLKGLFVQQADAETDGDLSTSEGLFVYTGSNPLTLTVGQRVRLSGSVSEFGGASQLSTITAFEDCGVASLPAAIAVSLPRAVASWEALEGMRVTTSQQLTVNEVYTLGRYGEVSLGFGRNWTPTQVAEPGAAALAVAEANRNNRVLLDDGISAQNPDPVIFPAPGLSASNSLRVGDSVEPFTAVVHEGFNAYRLLPEGTPQFVATNPRTEAPALAATGNLKVASFNVLNYFNGDGAGGGFPTARGATTALELERQQAKIVAALTALDADIIGLMELENDGYGEASAIAQLAAALSSASGHPYQFVAASSGPVGSDQISVGLLYRSDRISPQGGAAILDSSNSPVAEDGLPLFDDSRNRPTIAQRFALNDHGGELVVAVNHLKSKGSACDGDPDLGDGQGNCNLTRSRAAAALGQWLPATFGDTPALVIGDLNAYARENPLTALAAAGLTELFAHLEVSNGYSYVFDGQSGQLDHALANASLLPYVVDATEWHINTDEPLALDYNTEFKSAGQQASFYAPTPYRSSDHDPVVIAIDLPRPNLAPEASISAQISGRQVAFTANASDSDGEILSWHWDFGDGQQASGAEVSHNYAGVGSYRVTLTVTDDDGATTRVEQQVEVVSANLPPQARYQSWRLGPMAVLLSTSVDPDGRIRAQRWQFSDGMVARAPIVLRKVPAAGLSFSLMVTDNGGLSSSASGSL